MENLNVKKIIIIKNEKKNSIYCPNEVSYPRLLSSTCLVRVEITTGWRLLHDEEKYRDNEEMSKIIIKSKIGELQIINFAW